MEKYAHKFSKMLTQDPHYIPGYAGYCPQLKYNVGRYYGLVTAELLTSAEVRHSNRLVLHTGHVPAQESQGGLTLRSINGSDLKKMIPGYTGFTGHVPKSRFLMGKGYPIATNQALIDFGRQYRSDPTSQNFPGSKDCTTAPMPTIYPSNRGVVPLFTGDIPGYQFMYGHTFGHLSQNALEKSGIKKTFKTKAYKCHTLQ